MRAVDDLIAEGVSGRRVLVRTDLNVPLDKSTGDDHRRRPDPGQPAHAAGAPGRRRPGDRGRAPRPAKGAPDPQYSLAPVAARLGELLGVPVPLAADVAGDDARARAGALADGDVLLLENVRFEAAETSKDDAERGRARRPAGRPRRLLRGRRVRRRAPQARLGVRRRRAAAALRRPAGRPRARGAHPADQRPGAALRGRARRLEGQRQAGGHRGAAAQGRPAARRRRHVLHVPRRAGSRRRAARCWRPTRSTPAGGCWPRPATGSCCRSTSSAPTAFSADAETSVVAGRRRSRTG